MATRTTSRTVEFQNAFFLRGMSALQPAGRYTVETDEEPIDTNPNQGSAFRRVGTWIWLTSESEGRGVVRMASVDPADLEAALALDARTAVATDTHQARRQRP